MEKKKWNSAITGNFDGMPHVRGYKLTDMIEKLSFAQAVFLVLKGELPTKAEEAMINAILVSAVDHGVAAPSTTTARIVASCGNPLNNAVAAGVAAMGDAHAGAIEQAAKNLQEAAKKGKTVKEVARDLVEAARLDRTRVPGFGHSVYNVDPRTQALLKVAKRLKFWGRHIELALELEKQLSAAVGKPLPLNIDGVIAAIISEMGFDWRLGKGFFIIARTPGLVAHVYEELTREKPYRRLSEDEVSYDGPKPRKLK